MCVSLVGRGHSSSYVACDYTLSELNAYKRPMAMRDVMNSEIVECFDEIRVNSPCYKKLTFLIGKISFKVN